jgi:hypothetical protein
MRVRVKLMRRRGVRLSRQDFANAPAVEGTLSAAYLKTCLFANLADRTNPMAGPLLSPLYQVILVSAGNDILVLQGVERIDTREGRMGAVQEWHCEVVGR